MQYVGLDAQIRKNNFNSVLLLIAFPALLLGMFYVFFFFINDQNIEEANLAVHTGNTFCSNWSWYLVPDRMGRTCCFYPFSHGG